MNEWKEQIACPDLYKHLIYLNISHVDGPITFLQVNVSGAEGGPR